MPPTRSGSKWAEFLDLSVEPASDRPLFQQIYLLLRSAIVSHRLSAGSRLPSTRALAERLGVSRTSVVTAYEQLIAEGFIAGAAGSGTYVSHDVPPAIVTAEKPAPAPLTTATRSLSAAGKRYAALSRDLPLVERRAFGTGCCSIDAATVEAWRRIGAETMRRFDPVNLGYADPLGEIALRNEVAQYLRAARAVQCEPDQVVILAGAQQAIDLTLRTVIDPGSEVWVEDPGYLATRAALTAAGAQLVPVPVDGDGLVVQEGIARAPRARAAFVTPSHQYPTGSVMAMSRRLELIAWAARSGAWIVEDDYDSEFRYVGRPLASLQGLDGDGSVIYAGSLSKILFPGVRLGFAVIPRPLIEAFRAARFLADRQPPILLQSIAAEFMRQGLLTSHIRRMRQRYREARDVVVDSITRELGDLVEVEVPECGIQLVLHFRDPISDLAVAREAREAGVIVRPVSPLYLEAPARSGLVLGYSGFDLHQLRAAATGLARATLAVARRKAS
jgi:GntR family transcriptional regulator / MocR family aminotransferase